MVKWLSVTFLPAHSLSSEYSSRSMTSPSRMKMQGGLSNSTRSTRPSSNTWAMLKVEYASLRTLHTGSVAAMVSTASTTLAPSCSMVAMMVLVSVERMLAFTPLPRPSARTAMVEFSVRRIWTLSPQSSSLNLLMLLNAASMCIFMFRFPPEDEVAVLPGVRFLRQTRPCSSASSGSPSSPPSSRRGGLRSAGRQPSACR